MEENNNQNNEVNTQNDSASETQNAEEKSSSSKPSNRLILGIMCSVLVLGGGYWFLEKDKTSITDNEVEEMSVIESTQVVARVNGVELFGSDLKLQEVQAAQAAEVTNLADADAETRKIIQSQSLDAIVNTELIVQTANAAGIAVNQDDVTAEFDALIENIGGMEVAEQRLAELGISSDAFKLNLADDILIRRYLESVNDASELAVSEEEVQAFYTEVTAGQTEGVPPLEEVRFQIEEQLKFNKQQNVLLSLLEVLRAKADIEVLI